MPPIAKWPMYLRLAYFVVALALTAMFLRVFFAVLGGEQLNVWTWADARYFGAVWVIFSAVYYLGWAVWRFFLKR